MGRGFERVRLSSLAVGAGGVLLAGFAPDAIAAPQQGPVTVTAANAKWKGIGGFSHTRFSFSYIPPFNVLDASTTETLPARTDAFDRTFLATVGSKVYRDADGIVDVSGSTVTSKGTLRGLKTTAQFRFFTTRPTARALWSFKNPSTTAKTVTIRILSLLGSDTVTQIEETSDNDSDFEATDSWAVTSDGGGPTPDPVIVSAVGTASGLTTAPGNGTDELIQTFTVKIRPGKTRRIMVFAHLRRLVSSAITDAADFTNEAALDAAGLTAGLSATQRAEIINWNLG